MEVHIHSILLAQANKDVAGDPDFIGGAFGAFAEDLEFPLTLGHLGVDAFVVDAGVEADVEVLLDGGIRRGSDVVKAVALGARAVMIGRAYLWGLAAAGQAGVENVLDILSGGIDSALRGLGKSSIHDLTRDDVLIPPGFTRTLGGPAPSNG
jgi:glutamate synthase domain-containing protein 2